jgi:hypothetical protein
MLWVGFVSRCTLELGGELVAVADGGAFDVEYALFEPGDIELSATEPGTIRETGYRTTAGEARARLAQFGVTRGAAEEAAEAAKAGVARAYARGPAVRRIVDRLDAAELFDGRAYDPAAERYVGTWLDLPALAGALSSEIEPARAATLLQALHLAALIAERPEDEPVALATVELSMLRRPGERTYKRVSPHEPDVLVRALAKLKRVGDREAPDIGPGRKEIVAWLRARERGLPSASTRLAEIEAAVGAREPPPRGPLADAELWALESRLSLGETEGIVAQLDAIERRRGRLPGTTYLRARTALVAESEEPRAIAERVSALSTSMAAFHELQLLAAQAWAAAGDVRRAHAFARDLVENTAACDALRMDAHEVLDETGRAPTAPVGGVPLIPRPPLAPSGVDLKLSASEYPLASQGVARLDAALLALPGIDISIPPFRVEVRAERMWSAPPGREVEVEDLKTLSLPPGIHSDPPPHDELPRTPPAARLACTYLVRELGRELSIRSGITPRTDVEGLEVAQRHLFEAITGERVQTPEEEREVMLHGALLSELLVRRLGARWIDLESPDPGRWAMLVPSRLRPNEVCRVWPFGRVLRYIALRHKERDLVSYYLQLEAHAR